MRAPSPRPASAARKSGTSKRKTAKRGGKPRASATTARSSPKAAAKATPGPEEAARLIDERIAALGDWRGEALAEVRRRIHDADPEIVEEWKWRGTPVWSHAGIVCTGETYTQVVKLTFARGASLADPRKLFNSSLEGSTRRAIDIREGESLDAAAFQALLQAAIAENLRIKAPKSKAPSKVAKTTPRAR